MSLFIFFTFILFCAFAYFKFYKNNYENDQNKIIVNQLLQKNVKKRSNFLCTISFGISFINEPFDIYKTTNSIVLIRYYSNLIGQQYLNKRAESYLIILNEINDFKIELFTNYIKTESITEEKNVTLIVGELFSKSPFSSNEFIYTSKVKIKLPITF
jgi:hypothetical protein